jgi:hypothetical protein
MPSEHRGEMKGIGYSLKQGFLYVNENSQNLYKLNPMII